MPSGVLPEISQIVLTIQKSNLMVIEIKWKKKTKKNGKKP